MNIYGLTELNNTVAVAVTVAVAGIGMFRSFMKIFVVTGSEVGFGSVI